MLIPELMNTGRRFLQRIQLSEVGNGDSPIEGTKGNRRARHARVQAWGAQNQPRQKVKNPKQAIAIGLHEAGASEYESKEKNRQNLKRTKARERRGATGKDRSEDGSGREPTRSQLYEKAKRRNIAGRSKMNKHELERALH